MATILTKSTVYIGKNLFGIAKSCTCPDVETKDVELQNAIGSYNVPVAVNALTANIVLTGFDKDVFSKIANPFGELNMTVYGSLDTYSNETLSSSEQAKLVLRGSSRKFGLLGELTQQENLEQSLDFNISAAKFYINNVEKYHIDIPNLIWKVGGVDLLTTLKRNLALN